MIFDDNKLDKAYARDKAKGAIVNVDTRHIRRDAGLHNTFTTLELTLGLAKSINASGL
jgi:hypothetical protein